MPILTKKTKMLQMLVTIRRMLMLMQMLIRKITTKRGRTMINKLIQMDK